MLVLLKYVAFPQGGRTGKKHSKLRDDITETESLRYEFANLC